MPEDMDLFHSVVLGVSQLLAILTLEDLTPSSDLCGYLHTPVLMHIYKFKMKYILKSILRDPRTYMKVLGMAALVCIANTGEVETGSLRLAPA